MKVARLHLLHHLWSPENSLPTTQLVFALTLNRQQGRLNAQMRVTGSARGSRPNKIQISVQIVAGVTGAV